MRTSIERGLIIDFARFLKLENLFLVDLGTIVRLDELVYVQTN